ncbi:MAG: hypothetical protein WA840_20460, partial [Caulobacteraceae bacterium]
MLEQAQMQFGKISKGPAQERRSGSSLLTDSGRLELLNLAAVSALIAGPAAPSFNSAARAAAELEQSILL